MQPDGGFGHSDETDRNNEQIIARKIEAAWGYKLSRYPSKHPIDFWAEKDGLLVAHFEVKMRTHPSNKYPSVFLNSRKYHNLNLSYTMTGTPSYFVVGFSDGRVGYIAIQDVIPGPDIRVIDAPRKYGNQFDREPVQDVPIAALTFLDEMSFAV
jgi:hypothetical protein